MFYSLDTENKEWQLKDQLSLKPQKKSLIPSRLFAAHPPHRDSRPMMRSELMQPTGRDFQETAQEIRAGRTNHGFEKRTEAKQKCSRDTVASVQGFS